MLRRCRMDLHIHTLLSPCAELEMMPDLIVMQAQAQGLDVIGICDHNSAENVVACVEAARGTSVKVLPGVECQTREEVHVLGLFDEPEQAEQLQSFLWEKMPEDRNRPEFFGEQLVVDAGGELVRSNDRLLATSADISLEDVIGKIRSLDGLALPSHVDKTYAGLIGVLGFIPDGLNLDGVEVSGPLSCSEAKKKLPGVAWLGCVKSSDAHRLAEIGQHYTAAWIESRTVYEIRLALRGLDGRRLEER